MGNYRNEEYLDLSVNLFQELESVCDSVRQNILTVERSHRVSDILGCEGNCFNKLWGDIQPNNPLNKYSRNDFSGLYAFAEVSHGEADFKYIGISRTIRRRFFQHTKRSGRGSATWAYCMAKERFKEMRNVEFWESQIPTFQAEMIHPLRFTLYPIQGDMLMHLAEAFCVNRLQSEWNTFRTH